jgi:hypothetical protein
MWGKFEKFALRPLFSSVVVDGYAHAQLLQKYDRLRTRTQRRIPVFLQRCAAADRRMHNSILCYPIDD